MPRMTGAQYEESLRKMNFKVYLQGERVANPVDHPIIRPSMNSVKATYELAEKPEYEELMTATSHLSGKKINRFCHLHQSTDDLVKKVKMQRLLGQKTGACFQRCVGMDAINAVDSVTFEMDKKLGTSYHDRFIQFLTRMQEEDWTVDGAMTDPKGDRGLSPSQQADPDLFVHVVEKRADGIVVRGAKCHQTGALNSHWILIMPTISMTKEDADYAVSFVAPADAEGIFYIYGRQSCDTRKLEDGDIDVGNKQFGGHEALMVFDDLFIPWENVLMCGEYEFSGALVERFAGYHRQSYGGCKVGVGDVLIGAAALAADYNGAAKASHLKDKLIEMIHLNETLYSSGIACSAEGAPTASGTYLIDLMLANVCKQNVTRFPYEIARLAE
ncbi:MAG: 4-hydroxybutyryl-CoA dehydratase, partial [Veillonellaceae bacterium]|nr:4-hydroxybutyryl-CoA dehydratase [Veillonellaceae bacterium]